MNNWLIELIAAVILSAIWFETGRRWDRAHGPSLEREYKRGDTDGYNRGWHAARDQFGGVR